MNGNSKVKLYRKKDLQPMFPWEPGTDMALVSVSQADKNHGSPRLGDMIAINPSNHADMWLVAERFLKNHYEEIKI